MISGADKDPEPPAIELLLDLLHAILSLLQVFIKILRCANNVKLFNQCGNIQDDNLILSVHVDFESFQLEVMKVGLCDCSYGLNL